MSIRLFSAAALLVVLAQAANVNVINNCGFQVKATPSHEGTDEHDQYISPGDTFTRPADGEAWCLKLYGPGNNGQWAGSPTQLEWSNPAGGTLFYDLSDIDMGEDTTFLQHGMNLSSSDPSCHSQSSNCRPAICKPQGIGSTQPCEDAYNQPFDTRTLGASSQYDVNMHLCTNNGQPSSSSSSSSNSAGGNNSPAPAVSSQQYSQPASKPQTTFATQAAPTQPATTSAPANYGSQGQKSQGQSQGQNQGQGSGPQALAVGANGGAVSEVPVQQGNNVVIKYVMNTDVVTQVVTARDAEPTIAKRHMHMHHGHHNHA